MANPDKKLIAVDKTDGHAAANRGTSGTVLLKKPSAARCIPSPLHCRQQRSSACNANSAVCSHTSGCDTQYFSTYVMRSDNEVILYDCENVSLFVIISNQPVTTALIACLSPH